MTKSTSGFTIVELLIVIVVIAILASISIVAYTGIQDRAYASKAASIADAYIKILELYRVDHGQYPYEGESFTACFGQASDYPLDSNIGEGVCAASSLDQPVEVDTTFNNMLAPYTSALPSGELPTLHSELAEGVWFIYRGVYYASGDEGVGLTYNLKGEQACPRGDGMYAAPINTTFCTINLVDD